MNIRQIVENAKNGNQNAMQKLLKLSREDIRFTCSKLCSDHTKACSFAAEAERQISTRLDDLTAPEQYTLWARQTAAILCLKEACTFTIPQTENINGDNLHITSVIHLPQRYLNDDNKLSDLSERIYFSTNTLQYRLLILYFYVRFPVNVLAKLLGGTEYDIATAINTACEKAENAAVAFVKENNDPPENNEVSLFEIFNKEAKNNPEKKNFLSDFSIHSANKKSAGEFLKSGKNKIILATVALLLFTTAFVTALSIGLNLNNQPLENRYDNYGDKNNNHGEEGDYNISCTTLNYAYVPYEESGLNTYRSHEYIETKYVTLVQVLVQNYGEGNLDKENSSVYIGSDNNLYNASGKKKIMYEVYDVTLGNGIYNENDSRYLYNILMPGKISLNRLSINLILSDNDGNFIEWDYALEEPVDVPENVITTEKAESGNIVRIGDSCYYLLDAEYKETSGSIAQGYKTARSTLYMICLSPGHYSDDSYMNEEFSGRFDYFFDLTEKSIENELNNIVSVDVNTQDNTDSDRPGYFSKISIDINCSADTASETSLSTSLFNIANHIFFYYSSDSGTTLYIIPTITKSERRATAPDR